MNVVVIDLAVLFLLHEPQLDLTKVLAILDGVEVVKHVFKVVKHFLHHCWLLCVLAVQTVEENLVECVLDDVSLAFYFKPFVVEGFDVVAVNVHTLELDNLVTLAEGILVAEKNLFHDVPEHTAGHPDVGLFALFDKREHVRGL